MTPDITLRPADIDDALRLYEWRNDSETRRNSLSTDPIPFDRHLEWLDGALRRGDPTILIAEENGAPVGTIRYAIIDHKSVKLSWSVSAPARGRGVATRMVKLAAEGPLRHAWIHADIKTANKASIHVAQAAGMTLAHTQGELLHFHRAPLA